MYKLFRLLTVAAVIPLSTSLSEATQEGIHYSGVVDGVCNEEDTGEECEDYDERPWYYHQHLGGYEDEEDPSIELEQDTAWPAKRPDVTDFR